MSYDILSNLPPGTSSRTRLAMRDGRRKVVLRMVREGVEPFLPEKTPDAVLPLIELSEQLGVRYAVYDYLPGVTLRELVDALREADQPVPLPLAARVLIDAARAVGQLHDAHPPLPSHGGLSDSAILIGFDGVVRVLDYGVPRPSRYQPSVPGGTHGDVFALAAVLHSVLTDFAGTYSEAVDDGVPLPVPSAMHAEATPALDDVLGRATSRAFARRQVDASVLAGELEAVQGDALLTTEQLGEEVRSRFQARLDLSAGPVGGASRAVKLTADEGALGYDNDAPTGAHVAPWLKDGQGGDGPNAGGTRRAPVPWVTGTTGDNFPAAPAPPPGTDPGRPDPEVGAGIPTGTEPGRPSPLGGIPSGTEPGRAGPFAAGGAAAAEGEGEPDGTQPRIQVTAAPAQPSPGPRAETAVARPRTSSGGRPAVRGNGVAARPASTSTGGARAENDVPAGAVVPARKSSASAADTGEEEDESEPAPRARGEAPGPRAAAPAAEKKAPVAAADTGEEEDEAGPATRARGEAPGPRASAPAAEKKAPAAAADTGEEEEEAGPATRARSEAPGPRASAPAAEKKAPAAEKRAPAAAAETGEEEEEAGPAARARGEVPGPRASAPAAEKRAPAAAAETGEEEEEAGPAARSRGEVPGPRGAGEKRPPVGAADAGGDEGEAEVAPGVGGEPTNPRASTPGGGRRTSERPRAEAPGPALGEGEPEATRPRARVPVENQDTNPRAHGPADTGPAPIENQDTNPRASAPRGRNTTVHEKLQARGQERIRTPPLGVPAAGSEEDLSNDVVNEPTNVRARPSKPVESEGELPMTSEAAAPNSARRWIAFLLLLLALGLGAVALFAPQRLAALKVKLGLVPPPEPEVQAEAVGDEPVDGGAAAAEAGDGGGLVAVAALDESDAGEEEEREGDSDGGEEEEAVEEPDGGAVADASDGGASGDGGATIDGGGSVKPVVKSAPKKKKKRRRYR
ncbi:MAG: hypothetical protein IT380_17070 [Myxococcales bacterium]|nr:hypothetical protein [Myxococcales bacterium]